MGTIALNSGLPPAGLAIGAPARHDARLAGRLLWTGFVLFVACITFGIGWDRQWHATHVFETAFSPPHIAIYTTVILSAACVVYSVYSPPIRRLYGEGYWLPFFAFHVPGPLALLGAGYVLAGLAGAADLTWHSLFGLDETGWSFPHAMLGHAILLITWGYLAAFRVLGQTPAAAGLAAWLVGWVAVNTAQVLVGGPIVTNLLPQVNQAIARLPVLAQDAAFQHTTRIYLDWDLNRTNPWFIPLAVFSIGLMLGLVDRALRSPTRILGVTALAYASGVAGSHLLGAGPGAARLALLVPMPTLLAAALFLGLRRLLGKRPGWLVVGWLCSLWALAWPIVGAVMAVPPGERAVVPPITWALYALAGPTCAAGGWLGARAGEMVLAPTRRRVGAWAVGAGLFLPALTGAADLYLRFVTP